MSASFSTFLREFYCGGGNTVLREESPTKFHRELAAQSGTCQKRREPINSLTVNSVKLPANRTAGTNTRDFLNF